MQEGRAVRLKLIKKLRSELVEAWGEVPSVAWDQVAAAVGSGPAATMSSPLGCREPSRDASLDVLTSLGWAGPLASCVQPGVRLEDMQPQNAAKDDKWKN